MTTRSSYSAATAAAANDCEWVQAFNNKLKVRSFEQFSMLLFDIDDKDNNEQRKLLKNILFENHHSALYWYEYIKHIISKFPGRKLQLQRLINKALDCLTDNDDKEYHTNRHVVSLYLLSAQYKSSDKESLKYFEDIIWKKEIGRRFSNVFILWCDISMKVNGISDAVAIIQKGISSQAEPRHILQTKLQELQMLSKDNQNNSTIAFDDGEVIFKKRKTTEIKSNEEVTIEQPTIEIKTEVKQSKQNKSVKQSDDDKPTLSKTLKTSKSLLSSIGKCQRVVLSLKDSNINEVSNDSDDDLNNQSLADVISFKQPFSSVPFENSINNKFNSSTSAYVTQDKEIIFKKAKNNKSDSSDDEVTSGGITATVKLDVPEIDVTSSSSRKRKTDLSKYIDDKLLNFDPNKRLQAVNIKESIQNNAVIIENNIYESDDKENYRMTRSNVRICEKKSGNTNDTNNEKAVHVEVSDKKKRVSFARAAEAGLPLSNSEIKFAEKQKVEKKIENSSNISESRSKSSESDSSKHIVMNGRSYKRLGVLGKGGSSCVYRVLAEDGNIYAYKHVDVKGDSENVFENYTNEIELLRRLKGSPYIIELIDAEVNKEKMYIAMILEIGDVDLAKSLTQKQKVAAANSTTNLNPFFIRLIWQEMLEAVDHIHENRIVHGDLKPANFVFVKGHLKLIDFGIAKAFSNDTTNIYRESQIGTVNYMAPEAIAPYNDENEDNPLRMKLGRASDIWSLGCILYQMIYGRPPFAALNTIQKLHAIPNPKTEIKYPEYPDIEAIDTIKACLVRDPKKRATIRGKNGLLLFPFLNIHHHSNNSISSSNISEAKITLPELTIDGTTELIAIDTAPLVAIDDVRKAVQFVLNYKNISKLSNAIETEKLNDIVWRILTHKEYNFDLSKLISSSQTCDVKNVEEITLCPPSDSSKTVKNVEITRQPLKVLPNNLINQIQQSKKTLESIEKSSRAQRWMKPKDASPEKQDMRSILERRIADMRKFMEVENDQEETNTNFFN